MKIGNFNLDNSNNFHITKSSESKMPKYPIVIKSIGEDGNIFSIMGRVNRDLKRYLTNEGISPLKIKEIIANFNDAVMDSGSYNNALCVVMEWVDVE